MTLEELTAQRDALLAARYRGVRTVEMAGRRVTYATDAEMAAAMETETSPASIAGLVKRRLEPRGRRVFQSSYLA
jgi:hypothetical protein